MNSEKFCPRNTEDRVIVDGQLITSRGPGTAFEFALALVRALYGNDKMNEIAKPMVMYETPSLISH